MEGRREKADGTGRNVEGWRCTMRGKGRGEMQAACMRECVGNAKTGEVMW